MLKSEILIKKYQGKPLIKKRVVGRLKKILLGMVVENGS